MSREMEILIEIYKLCGGDTEKYDLTPGFMFGYIERTIEMLKEDGDVDMDSFGDKVEVGAIGE